MYRFINLSFPSNIFLHSTYYFQISIEKGTGHTMNTGLDIHTNTKGKKKLKMGGVGGVWGLKHCQSI